MKRPNENMGWPRLRERVDRLFQNVIADPWREFTGTGGMAPMWAPDVDVRDSEKQIEVRAELPGMDPADIQITVRETALTIAGEKREERREEKDERWSSEIFYGSFQRVIELPEAADPDQVDAEYDRGVLRVRIGKKAGSTPRRVAVKNVSAKPAAPGMDPSARPPSEEGV
jgi:HSP20 family protein